MAVVMVMSNTPGVCQRIGENEAGSSSVVQTPTMSSTSKAGHVGGEFRASHDLVGEVFGVDAWRVADQRDEPVPAVVPIGPYAMDGDPEFREGCQVAIPMNDRVLLQSLARSQGVDPQLKHQIASTRHSAATARPCKTARAPMIRSHLACSARPFGRGRSASAAAVSCRLIG